MCILCVASRWSRRVVTMLPWLVIPFIIIWAFSQLLPPGYRLEVTSTRLACLGVLMSSLGWYELLMPWLSSWRARRSAILRERRLVEAQEAAKWKKEATRRCRNCLAAYKIQSPGGGKFTCTSCGHVSKRPVLEVPSSASHAGCQGNQRTLHAGVPLGKGGVLRSTVTRHHDRGCWSRRTQRKNCWLGEGTCEGETCKAWKILRRVFWCIGYLLMCLRIVWRLITGLDRVPSESCRVAQMGQDGFSSLHESRSEKARKKANEKRQARLERELLESEEKKQREEVTRLVEERRRQREEKLQVEKESEREAAAEREREIRRVKELERRRKGKLKEKAEEEIDSKGKGEIHFNDTHARCDEQLESDKSLKDAKLFKSLKLSATGRCNQGLKNKISSEIQTGPDSLKHTWNVKPRLSAALNSRSSSKLNVVWNNTKTDTHLLVNKARKVEASIFSNKKPISLKHDVEESTSDLVQGIAPRFNAWAKGSEALRLHFTSSNSDDEGNIGGQNAESNTKDGYSLFDNKAVGTKQASAAGTSAGIQRPIAPPSTSTPSLHQLFSSPTIFETLDLTANITGESKQPMQGNTNLSFGPEHTFFEAPSHVSFQSCTGVPTSMCPASPVHGSLCSLPQVTVSADNGGVLFMDASNHSISFEPKPKCGKSTDTHCHPVSPCFVVSDPVISDLKTELSPTSISHPSNGSNFFHKNHDAIARELYPICLDKTTGGDERQQEQNWTILAPSNVEVYEQLELAKENEPDAMMLPNLCTVQSLFDAEIFLPDSLSFAPWKNATCAGTLQSSENVTHAGQLLERKSLWSDISAFNPAVQIWDDGDNHQKLPPEFVDCITQEIMKDPVITADGHSYERVAIEEWLRHHDTSPKTGEVLPPPPGGLGVDKTLRPNHILRGQIIEYNEKVAKMQQNSVSWSNTGKDGLHLPPFTLEVSAFY